MPSRVKSDACRPSSQPSTNAGTSKRRVLLIGFLALALAQSAALIAISVVGHRAFVRLDAKLQLIEPYSSVFATNAAPKASVEKFGAVLRAVVGDFLLGASGGRISAFIADVLETDFAGLAANVSSLAENLEAGMLNTSCSRWIAEVPYSPSFYNPPYYVNVSCGTKVYPMWGPGQLQCDGTWCAGTTFRQLGSYAEAVAEKLLEIPTTSGPATGQAALSNGVFGIGGILDWVNTQTGLSGWKAAGLSCQALVARAKPIAWDGCYEQSDGSQSCWNVTSNVATVLGYADQVCQGLANFPWS